MPAYNEQGHLRHAVGEVHEGLGRRRTDGRVGQVEILVVENGSTDGTPATARSLASSLDGVTVHSRSRADYGAALRRGIETATGDIVVCFDVDCYDLEFLDAALGALERADIVLGSKRARGSVDARPWPRRVVTATFAGVLHLGFGLDVSDTHGMKAMRRAAMAPLVPECHFDGDLFDTELVVRAVRAGRRVVELPVNVAERRPPRTSIWRRSARATIGLARLRLLLAREPG